MNFFHEVVSHGRWYAKAILSRLIAEENQSVLVPMIVLENERRFDWE
jgi:hypothetical protein